MNRLFESNNGSASAKDGGFVFQAIVSHKIQWKIVEGLTVFDPKHVNTELHTLDVFPDIKLKDGYATSTYVLLSEVNILKRKFDLASEAIKKILNPEYAKYVNDPENVGLSNDKLQAMNHEYFSKTSYDISLLTNHIVLREVSTSGLDSGSPRITLKISTGMVDTLDGKRTPTWEAFRINIGGSYRGTIGSDKIATIREFDDIENQDDVIFRTIIPSLVLEFSGDSVAIETYSNQSSQVAAYMATDYDNLFTVKDNSKAAVESPTE